MNRSQNQEFLKIFEIRKKIKKCHDSETIKIFEILFVAYTSAIKISTKKSWSFFFSKFSLERDFITLFFFPRSPYGSTAFKIWLKLHIIKEITERNKTYNLKRTPGRFRKSRQVFNPSWD